MRSDCVRGSMLPGFYNCHDRERGHPYNKGFINKRVPGYILARGAEIAACRIGPSSGKCLGVRAEQCALPLFFVIKIDVNEMGSVRHVVVGVSSYVEAVSWQPA